MLKHLLSFSRYHLGCAAVVIVGRIFKLLCTFACNFCLRPFSSFFVRFCIFPLRFRFGYVTNAIYGLERLLSKMAYYVSIIQAGRKKNT